MAETPAPFLVDWWKHETLSQGVEGFEHDTDYRATVRLGEALSGFMQGSIDLPVYGVWLVKVEYFVPEYEAHVPKNEEFPDEAYDRVNLADSIKITLNDNVRDISSEQAVALPGHKTQLEFQVEGQLFTYRFDFKSGDNLLHSAASRPFLTAGEVSLLHDMNAPPAPASSALGTLKAVAIDAVDARKVTAGGRVSNGYVPKSWLVQGDPVLSVYKGSTLVMSAAMPGSKLNKKLRVGDYSCMVRHRNFYTAFVRHCNIKAGERIPGPVPLVPVLDPGQRRFVLTWGGRPRDLDSYLRTPTECVVFYGNQKCNHNLLTFVKEDVDERSHKPGWGGDPETITVGLLSAGTYVYKVNEYKAHNTDGIEESDAVVTYYDELSQRRFVHGRDGFMSGFDWLVFEIDGSTGELR